MIPFALASGALVLAVLLAVVVPLLRRGQPVRERREYDRAVYRDQLQEVDRDLARGTIAPAEADAARLEIQRRLLAADAIPGTMAAPGRSPLIAAVAGLLVLAGAGGLYWRLGAPTVPGAPFQDRPPAAEGPDLNADILAEADRLNQILRTDPSNAGVWARFGKIMSNLGDWPKAADAYRRAIGLGFTGPDIQAALGETLVMAERGVVTPAARQSFAAALALSPKDPVARYYMALADGQAGDSKAAIDAWLSLAGDLPNPSPMRDEIARRVGEAARASGGPAPALPAGAPAEAARPGPTPEQMAAAANMTPAERERMIGGMIETLAAKLRDDPANLDGWMRLGGAYAVRGEGDKAADAYDQAARLKQGDPAIKMLAVRALMAGLSIMDPFPPRALALVREIAAVKPDAPEILWYQGLAAAHERRLDEARRYWTMLLAQLPEGGEDRKMVSAAIAALKGP